MSSIFYKFKSFLNKNYLFYLAFFVIVSIYSYLVINQLGSVPNVFFDEANYASEVQSFANFGTDIHGIHNPVYLTSVWGQGQAILYAWCALPFVKIFGFSMFTFRIAMSILGISLIALVTYVVYRLSKDSKTALLILLSLVTSPWIYTTLRWVLDANIAPIVFLIGCVLITYAFSLNNVLKQSLIIAGSLLIALSAYGYSAFWIFLPVFLIFLSIYVLKNKLMSFGLLLLSMLLVALTVIPLLIFAYRVNVLHSLHPVKFLFFDIPAMPGLRSGSLIDFSHGDAFDLIWNNFLNGINLYVIGNDTLPWNVVPTYGVVHPLFLIFALVGMFIPTKNFPELKHFINILRLQVIAFLPIAAIVIPNYNHWNAINIPLVIFSGLFIAYVAKKTSSIISIVLVGILILTFNAFQTSYWSPEVFHQTGLVNYQEVKKINEQVEGKKLFITGLDWDFAYFKIAKNDSPKRYMSDQDKLNGNLLANAPAPKNRYENIYNIIEINKVGHSGDYVLMSQEFKDSDKTLPSVKFVKKVNVADRHFNLYKIN